MTSKHCIRCEQVKSVGEFYRHEGHKDGLRSECKDCTSTRGREYRAQHLEEIKLYDARRYIKNRERKIASAAKWQKENPDRVRVKNARWRAANPEKRKVANAKWLAANRDKMRAIVAQWRAENPEMVRAENFRRRALNQNADGVATARQIAARCEFYGEACYICNGPADAVDHVIPLAAGGTNWPANLRPICGRCNSIKHSCWPYDFVAARQELRA